MEDVHCLGGNSGAGSHRGCAAARSGVVGTENKAKGIDQEQAGLVQAPPIILQSPWQGGWAPPAPGPCSITNNTTVNRVFLERDKSGIFATITPKSVAIMQHREFSKLLKKNVLF